MVLEIQFLGRFPQDRARPIAAEVFMEFPQKGGRTNFQEIIQGFPLQVLVLRQQVHDESKGFGGFKYYPEIRLRPGFEF